MSELILFNKPFNVLSQFTDDTGRGTLADYIDEPGFYPAGRLDRDSEGLLLLTTDGRLQQEISHPRHGKGKVYWAQVEGQITNEAIAKLCRGIKLKDGMSLPAGARLIPEPQLWERNPPIRKRLHIPTSWVEVTLYEGRNRQVRRMTAAIGYPTLRLIRHSIGDWELGSLQPGQYRKVRV